MKSKLGSIPKEWHRQLKNLDVLLSTETAIAASDDGNGWIISDNGKYYTVLPDGDKLVVYNSELDISVGTIAFTVPDEWRRRLKDRSVLLSPKATVATADDGDGWTITDNGKYHTILPDRDNSSSTKVSSKYMQARLLSPFLGKDIHAHL
jgi:hypothetical protein